MSDTSLATAPNAQPVPQQASKPEKKERVSKKIAEVVNLLLSGECRTQKAAAERVGVTPQYVCTQLKKPAVRVFYERAARDSIAAGVMRAAARINGLVDASSEHVSFDAAKHVLGIAGIKPAADAQVSVNIELKAGYVIDLSERPISTETRSIEEKPLVINGVVNDKP